MILHTHIVLHLFIISNFLDCLSLINKKLRIEQDGSEKLKKETEEETAWQIRRRLLGDLALTARTMSCFG